jgi:FtsP/CotA-like multicopper oxidase with cupredoxin domain
MPWHDAMHEDGPVPTPWEMAPSEGPWEVPLAEDLDPDPDVVAIRLRASSVSARWVPGQEAAGWGYEGATPGPRIEARVGDRLVVDVHNDLSVPHSVHWHGLRIPAAMDGGAEGPMLEPGESVRLDFVLPDAGTFWYHAHHESDEQIERGLYGPLVVRGPDEPHVDRERVLILDDVLLDDDGELAPFDLHHAMLGRQGNVALVNGRARPILDVEAGALERWRIVVASNARYFDLDLPGYAAWRIAEDGGPQPRPQPVEWPLLLVPGERVDLLVRMHEGPGDEADLVSRPYDRGHASADDDDLPLLRLRHVAPARPLTAELPTRLADTEPAPSGLAVQTLVLKEQHGGHGGSGPGGGMAFSFDGESWPDVTPRLATQGDWQLWRLVNDTAMDHPFHLHGFRFQVVGGDAVWKDTVNVPADATVEIAVSFAGFAGAWLYHCHILEHAERGMMGLLEVDAGG